MNYLTIDALQDRLKPLGRTLPDPQSGVLYCNWTLSGVEILFRGRTLAADLCALPGAEADRSPLTGQITERPTWPWCAVILDEDETPARTFAVEGETCTQLLFHSGEEELHRIRLIKRTENGKGYLGVRGFWLDGEILPRPAAPAPRQILFIGDSITCGFGNTTEEKDRLFFSCDEDGWQSHGAIAARMLGMEPTIISSSGICVTAFAGWPHPYAMDGLYDYTDRMLEEKLGRTALTRWDFEAHPADYVVLNLGTNDCNAMAAEGAQGPAHHARAYRDFVAHLRAVHPRAYILCALGSMDYYLYTDIQRIVADYRRETGDDRVSCFRYPKMEITDPVGACGHPHAATHRKMARALADHITALENRG